MSDTCFSCGKSLVIDDVGGVGLMIIVDGTISPQSFKSACHSLGKYANNSEFAFCFECLIDSLMRKSDAIVK